MDFGGLAVLPHGDAAHTQTYLHLGGTVVETVTGNKTFADLILAASGTAAAPGIAFSAQAALGFFRPAAGRLGLTAPTSIDLYDGTSLAIRSEEHTSELQ